MSSCNKTPVAVLHELCVRRGVVEQYNLVAAHGTPNDRIFEMSVETDTGIIGTEQVVTDRVLGMDSSFTYLVIQPYTILVSLCSACGSGKTKKEAKHNAAKAALSKLNVPAITSGVQMPGEQDTPFV